MTRRTACLMTASFLAFAPPALAQKAVVLSVCQDGLEGGASQTHEDMGRFLSGNWGMSANGTGLTLGVNVMNVTLSWDDASETLMLSGQGMTAPLHPIRYNLSEDGDAPFDMSMEALTPTEMTDGDAESLNGCANLPRYYWQVNSGPQKSWGGFLFYDNNNATGFMANSAGGSRNVFMSRSTSR
ncbi:MULTISPECIES: hypothetical protein [Pacificibacter]|uniref:hypothetical protein n=1 Tax=Pacificibacter TaxID=1042323 RepID=UPI001C0A6274|nr:MULTISPECIES: hypothetical protein [Pacificibacter]MBU2936360.1 hypothetical protein [Pacificibacter marinus]MDO6616602.1 hypothetical protein [Pacificibacter sp. 1_MG-2023]